MKDYVPEQYEYTVVLEPQSEERFTGTEPSLPEVVTEWDTEAEAMAEEAIRAVLADRQDHGVLSQWNVSDIHDVIPTPPKNPGTSQRYDGKPGTRHAALQDGPTALVVLDVALGELLERRQAASCSGTCATSTATCATSTASQPAPATRISAAPSVHRHAPSRACHPAASLGSSSRISAPSRTRPPTAAPSRRRSPGAKKGSVVNLTAQASGRMMMSCSPARSIRTS